MILKITGHKLCQFIIKKYINQKIDWPKEIKIAQKLIKTYFLNEQLIVSLVDHHFCVYYFLT